MKNQILTIIAFFLCFITLTNAQENNAQYEEESEELLEYGDLEELADEFSEVEEDILTEAEFSIPSAPAFSLMGITPELVPRPGVVRNFKVDWRIRDYDGAPDLAVEAMPIWILFFNNDDLSKYREASGFARMLSTLSFSLSTASFNSTNHLGYALKMNLFRAKDPLLDGSIVNSLFTEIQDESAETNLQLLALEEELQQTESLEDRKEIKREIRALKSIKRDIIRSKRADLEYMRQDYIADNWNATMLDVAFGKLYTFDKDLIDSVGINNQGYGVWLNGGIKSGKHGFLSGIVKLSRYGEVDAFQAGLSLRYGNPKYNFYIESMYQRTKELIDPEFDPFTFKETSYRMSYGGDFRLSRGILLNFSLQTKFDQNMKFREFLPIANITCLMR